MTSLVIHMLDIGRRGGSMCYQVVPGEPPWTTKTFRNDIEIFLGITLKLFGNYLRFFIFFLKPFT